MYCQHGFGQGVSFVWEDEGVPDMCVRGKLIKASQIPRKLTNGHWIVPRFPNGRFSNQDEVLKGEENLGLNYPYKDTRTVLMEFAKLKRSSTHVLHICRIIPSPIKYSVYCQKCTLGVRKLIIGGWGPLNKHHLPLHDLNGNCLINHWAPSPWWPAGYHWKPYSTQWNRTWALCIHSIVVIRHEGCLSSLFPVTSARGSVFSLSCKPVSWGSGEYCSALTSQFDT